MRRFLVWLAAGALVGAFAPTGLAAQGYGIYEHGTCMMGRAGAGIASPCADGSAIFYNPAGITGSGKGVISGGVTYIGPSGSFTNDVTGVTTESEPLTFFVPHLYWTRDLDEKYSVGLGVFAPYGLTTEWDENNFEGRFLGYHSEIQSIYIQPTFAIRVNDKFRIGGGFDYSIVKVALYQRADLYSTTLAPGVTGGNLGFAQGTDFADIKLDGDGTGIGFNMGAIWQATPKLAIGLKYLSQQEVYINKADANITQVNTGIILPANHPLLIQLGLPAGTPLDQILAQRFLPGQPLEDQTGSTKLTFPSQLVFGVAVDATPKIKVLADLQWVNWEKFQTLALQFERLPQKIIVENYENTIGVRVGGEYAINSSYTARLGYLSHGAAAPDQTVTPNLPEGPRNEFTAGLGASLGQKLHVDLAYQYIDQADRRGRTTDGGMAEPTPAVNNGLYTFSAHLIGATFTYKF
jgi:long-chain fatty acid transport protein